MGSLMGRTPRPAPPPARPVTAVTKTPDIEMDDTELTSEQLKKKKTGKKRPEDSTTRHRYTDR